MRTLWRIFVGILATIGALVVLAAAAGIVIAVVGRSSVESLPDHMVLRVNIENSVPDQPRDQPFFFGKRKPVLRDIVMGLRAAASDDRVSALAIHMGGVNLDLATAQELRDAIAEFRAAGKTVRLFTEDLGSMGGGSAAYYMASACNEIWVQPSGGVGLIGISMEVPFGRGLLDKLDVKPVFLKRKEYKSAVESITRTGLSGPARENLQTVLDSLYGQLVAGVAKSRKLDAGQVRQLVNGGPYLAQEAVKNGLIDHVGYWDEFMAENMKAAGPDAKTVFLEDYLAGIKRPSSSGPTVALIYGNGSISMGSIDNGAIGGGFEGQSVADAFAKAIDNDSIKAILFRINSPGGSYIASDVVRREVRRARDAGKPVIVSMGNAAASGGYFVALPANRIVAHPATLTGSIGVFGGKVVTEKLWNRLGINWDALHAGDHAGMWSFINDFPPGSEERFRAMIDFIYSDFSGKAMKDRGWTADHLDQVAGGRVWTGKDALDNGVVDALGGYEVAIGEVKKALGLDANASIDLRLWPRPKSSFEEVMGVLRGDGKPLTKMGSLFGSGESSAVAKLAARLGLSEKDLEALAAPAGVLQMPPIRVRY